jgi:hypothetical protein
MLRCAFTLAALCSIHAFIAVAQQATTSPDPDPIVGVWALDTISVGSYRAGHVEPIRSSGGSTTCLPRS